MVCVKLIFVSAPLKVYENLLGMPGKGAQGDGLSLPVPVQERICWELAYTGELASETAEKECRTY